MQKKWNLTKIAEIATIIGTIIAIITFAPGLLTPKPEYSDADAHSNKVLSNKSDNSPRGEGKIITINKSIKKYNDTVEIGIKTVQVYENQITVNLYIDNQSASDIQLDENKDVFLIDKQGEATRNSNFTLDAFGKVISGTNKTIQYVFKCNPISDSEYQLRAALYGDNRRGIDYSITIPFSID